MRDEDKTREQLIQELSEMRCLVNHKQMEELAYQANIERFRLETVLDTLPVGVFIVDASGQLIKANELVNKIWGGSTPLSDSISECEHCQGWWTKTGESVQSEEWSMTRALAKGETSLEEMVDILHLDGTRGTILNSAAPIRDTQGQIIGAVVVIQDITHQRQTEEMLRTVQQVSDIIEFLPDSTFVIDRNKKIIAWNRAIEVMTGVCKEDIIGKGDYAYAIPFYGKPKPMLPDIILSDDKQIELDYEYFERKENILYAEIFSPSAFNGKGAFLWGKASPLFDNERNIVGAIESIRDISDRKQMEDELRKHRDRLELLVTERTIKITKINEQLHQEIAEHKQTEEALREARDYVENLINYANAPIIVWEPSLRITRFNRSFEHLTGRSACEVIGEPLDILFPEHMREDSMAHIRRTATGERWEVLEIPILNIDGTVRIVLWNSATLYCKDGKTVVATIAQGQDITERKQIEEALRESEAKYRTLVEAVPEIIIHTDIDGNCVWTNKAGINFFGEDIYQYNFQKYIYPATGKEVIHIEALLKRKDGKLRLLQWHFKALMRNRQVTGLLATARDISSERKIAEQLKESTELLEGVLNAIPDVIGVQYPDHSIVCYNKAGYELLGKTPEEVYGKKCYELIGRNRECEYCATRQSLKSKKMETIEKYFPEFNAYMNCQSNPILDEYGEVGLVIEQLRDVTDRKLAEQALRLSEERFSKAFNGCPNPMVISTIIDGQFLAVNDSFLCISGYTHEETIGHTIVELNLWPKFERVNMLQILYEQGEVRNLEINFYKKSGELRVGLLSTEIINLNGIQCLLSVINDITEYRQMEKEMSRLDRLNLVGEMAAGIGHEIRNPLTTVRGFLQMLGGKEECIQYKEYYELMIEEMDRANMIITEFLSLAKNKNVNLKMHSVNQIINAIYPLIQVDATRADKSIKLELDNVLDLLLDEKEIRQLVINLVRNGLEAMSLNGILTIKTFMDGDEIVLAVQDQGTMIQPNVLEKIGTPFFTTKENGTGLGLSICYSIAARHKATINIETGPSGTTFFVRFMLPDN